MPDEKKDAEKKDESKKNEDVIEIKVPKLKVPDFKLERIRENPWIVSTIILGIITLILLFSLGGSRISGKVISSNNAGELLLDFYKANGITDLSVGSVEDVSGLYRINFEYRGSTIPVYLTKDGKLIGSLDSFENLKKLTEDSNNAGSSSNAGAVSSDDDPFKGNPNAPITIVEFSDFQCPFCKSFFKQTLPVIDEVYIQTGKVKFVYRDFPLNFHEYAQKAAEAGECVDELGGDKAYFKMHDKMLTNQDSLDIENLKKWAKEFGYDISDCLDSGKMTSEVQKDFEDGEKYGVSGTPAFFINGKMLSGAQPFSEFKKIIDEELKNLQAL